MVRIGATDSTQDMDMDTISHNTDSGRNDKSQLVQGKLIIIKFTKYKSKACYFNFII